MPIMALDCNRYFDRNSPGKSIRPHYLGLILIIRSAAIAITQKIYSQYNSLNLTLLLTKSNQFCEFLDRYDLFFNYFNSNEFENYPQILTVNECLLLMYANFNLFYFNYYSKSNLINFQTIVFHNIS